MLYFAYIDEFGHIGPYVSREHPHYKTSPIFGLGGVLLPASDVRAFGEFFLAHKEWLLGEEMRAHDIKDPFTWEKKGSALYTSKNDERYRRQLTRGTNRLLNRLRDHGGRTVYVGSRKPLSVSVEELNRPAIREMSKRLYRDALEALLRHLDHFGAAEKAEVLVVMDEHHERDIVLDQAARMMYSEPERLRHLLEPPYQVESHRYQTVQCADWVCGLVGRFGAYRAAPDEFGDFQWAEDAFAPRVDALAICEGMPLAAALPLDTEQAESAGAPETLTGGPAPAD